MLRNLTGHATAFARNLIKAHLEWICRITRTRPLPVLCAAFLLLGLAFLSIGNIRFESDIFKLFPTQKGPLRLFLESMEWSGGARDAYFLLEGESPALIADAELFASRLKALQVEGKPAFNKVVYQVYDPAEAGAFAAFVGYAAAHPQLFLPPEDAGLLAEKLNPRAMDCSLRRVGTELASQAGMGMRDIIRADPLSLRDLLLPRLKAATQAFALDSTSPYFLSRDGRLLIMIAEPAQPVNDMPFARKLVAGINGARKGFTVKITCAGAHLSAVIDESVMKRNIISCVVSSLFVVLGLFYFTYRRVLPTLLIPWILFFGTALALGSAGLFLTSINIISLAFTALIIGLGTDYSIHLYDRFYHERSIGRDTEEALRLAVIDTGHGVFTAAATTALPFLALTLSDVRALSELGLLVGLGVIFSLYATFFFLPPLLFFTERKFPRADYKPLPGFGLGAVWDFAGRYFRPLGLGTLLLIAVLLAASFYISFEGELKNLQPRHSEAFLTQEKMEKHLSLSEKQMLLVVDGKSLDDVTARGRRVATLAEKYKGSRHISAYSSLDQALNAEPVQREILGRLVTASGGGDQGRRLRASLERNGFAAEPFQAAVEGLSRLRSGAPVGTAEAVERLLASPLRGVVDRHLVRGAGEFHYLIYLYYSGTEFDQTAFLRELTALDPTIRATSVDLVSNQLAGSVKKSFLWGGILGGALVLLLLLTHFASLAGIVCTLFPVLAGVIAMLGVMALTGMRLNFMNSMVLVTILGMGSDYGLHIMHRVSGRLQKERRIEFVQAGRAVLLSALTTIAGFGSLAFADYGAMSSIGWATNYGVGATVLFALVSLPAFLPLVVGNNYIGGENKKFFTR
jgi:predicted RND superfamily exporter protein